MATYQYDRKELDEIAKLKWFQIVKKYRAKENLKTIKQGEVDMGLVIAFRNLEKILK